MTAEQLQKAKDFFKSMGLPLPKGMGGSNDDSEAVEYRTGKAVDPSPKGDAFAGNVEKRVEAAQALANRVKGGISDLASRFVTGANKARLNDKRLVEEAEIFNNMPELPSIEEDAGDFSPRTTMADVASEAEDRELEKQAEIFNNMPELPSIEEDTGDYGSSAKLGDLDDPYPDKLRDPSDNFNKYGMFTPADPTETVEYRTGSAVDPSPEGEPEITLGDYGRADQANSDQEASMRSDMKMQKKAARKAKRKSKGGYVDPQGKEPLIATEAGRTIDEIGAPERGLGDYAADAMAESAEPAPEVDYSDQAIALFKNTHGTSFDPKSRMDRGKLEKMKAILAERGGLGEMSPNQFALQVYRSS